jgi:hypothetical protein
MNDNEKIVANHLRSLGYRVTNRGWPDFFCERNGELMAVEVKAGSDQLRDDQRTIHALLRKAGVRVCVVRAEAPEIAHEADGVSVLA